MVTQIFPTTPVSDNLFLGDTPDVPFGIALQFNFRKNDFDLSNGNIVITDEIGAIQQWITNTLVIEKGIHPIFNRDYGTYVHNLPGKGFPREALALLIPDLIEEELTKDSRISSVENFTVTYSDSNMFINFDVRLISGVIFNHDNVWVI